MKNFILIYLLFCFSQIVGQDLNSTNYISGKIMVPIIVDQIMTEDHFLDDRRDSNTRYDNVSFDISTQLKNIPIYFWGKGSFRGSYIEEVYDLVTITTIFGKIDPKTNLGTITVQQKETKNVKAHPMNVCDYDYEYSYNYEYKNLTVRTVLPIGTKEKDKSTSYFFKPNKNTVLTVSNYVYFEDTKCPNRNNYKEFVYKNFNEEYLKEKLSGFSSYFSFNVNWNGKTIDDIIKESLTITEIRGENLNWEPPSSPYLRDGLKSEPKSIAVYSDKIKILNLEDLDQENMYTSLEKGFPALVIANISKVPKIKVLERVAISKILQEIELSESGLVKEETKVENKLMKEEMAVIIGLEIDADKKQFKLRCNIASKNKEIQLNSTYLPLSELFGINYEIIKVITKEALEQFKITANPKEIFMDPNF
jgi:hypothetical protein